MLNNKHLKQWSCIVSERMPNLSIPQAIGLATWSFGMVVTKSSSLTQVSEFIGAVNNEKPNTVRQRLKEWYQEEKAKKGDKRRTLDVSRCFASLLLWVISLLPQNIQQIAHNAFSKSPRTITDTGLSFTKRSNTCPSNIFFSTQQICTSFYQTTN
ncbi:hypothetical protein [Nostoc sp. C052]|uniref:hypothetical protein n=1 Tax=Nostoc sp. C052 TaxID=2576902 RepID=UPI0015C3514A|nr:hypothetical protein [Nostoc sp. C052]